MPNKGPAENSQKIADIRSCRGAVKAAEDQGVPVCSKSLASLVTGQEKAQAVVGWQTLTFNSKIIVDL